MIKFDQNQSVCLCRTSEFWWTKYGEDFAKKIIKQKSFDLNTTATLCGVYLCVFVWIVLIGVADLKRTNHQS